MSKVCYIIMDCMTSNLKFQLQVFHPPGDATSYFTTDDSESEQSAWTSKHKRKGKNVLREVKTSRYNRGPHDKTILDKREKIATRHSSRIKQLLEEKKKIDEVREYFFLNIHYK